MAEPSDSSEVSAAPADIERRVSTRYPCSLTTSCRLIASVRGSTLPARVRNLSVGGISLVVNRHFESGSVLTIELKSLKRDFACTLELTVCYCVDHPNGESILGGRFLRTLDDDELSIFLAR